MATNKHAMIRYQALDTCFSNKYKRFFIEDLIDACNKALEEFYIAKEDSQTDERYHVKRRTIFTDIAYMESSEGWSAPIKRYYEGHRCYYRYEDENFSINKRDFSEAELDKLDEALIMLNRLNGEAGFDWVSEFIANFEDKLGRKKNSTPVIGYEKNPFLKGLDNLSVLYNYIVNKQVLKITYRHFKKGEMIHFIHPYYLKQYNNRWFLFGITEQNKTSFINLPLDRIERIEPVRIAYIPNNSFDFEEYFDDVIGITIPKHSKIEAVILQFSEHRFPYIQSKPLHPSQTIVDLGKRIVRINVIPNKELIALLLSFGSDVTVLSPTAIRQQIYSIILEEEHNYGTMQNDCTE